MMGQHTSCGGIAHGAAPFRSPMYERAEVCCHLGARQIVDGPMQVQAVAGASRSGLQHQVLTASHCGASRRGPGTRPRAVVCCSNIVEGEVGLEVYDGGNSQPAKGAA